jgi:3-oxoacyl-[acyl-carrier protein] reductase
MGAVTGARVEAVSGGFESIRPGDFVVFSKTILEGDVDAFAALSGDRNPLHMDSEFASRTHLGRRVVHGMLVASYVSALIGTKLPGTGSLWMEQRFGWRNPVFIGDTLEFTLRVTHKSEGSRTLALKVTVMNQNGKMVMDGEGTVALPEFHERRREIPIHETVAFVSNGSRGIGAAVARALARAGASVVINCSDAEAGDGVCQAIAADGGEALAVCADTSDAVSVAGAVESASGRLGRAIDVLIHCAAAPVAPCPAIDMEWADIQQALDTHVRSAFHCIRAVVPGMLQRKSGRIVSIGSMAAWGAPPAQWGAFAMAQAALKSLTKSLAAELGPSGIRVNMVSPGTREDDPESGIPERIRKLQAMQTPLRRLALADDIAETVVFLCSEGSRFITGADIPVCGGAGM